MKAVLNKNDKLANWIIYSISVIVFLVVVALDRIAPPPFPFNFDVHVFAFINSVINSIVAVLLIAALMAVRNKKYRLHRQLMLSAIICSIFFLVFYIAHHLFAGSTVYGGEGIVRYFYYFILITHIVLAALILPFILFTAYRGLTAEYGKHTKIARYTFPLWLYVAVSGVLVYWLVSPYY